ncbi:poly(ADP-ribose) glycohydrolase [Entamoeba marina]
MNPHHLPSYFSPLFGELPFIPVSPIEPITSSTHLILPCYSLPSNASYALWTTIYPLFSKIKTLADLTQLYSTTSPTTLSLLTYLPTSESTQFLRDTLPIIISLAALHPRLFPTPISLPRGSLTVPLNRLQIASLFALSFLGVFRLPIEFRDAKQFPRCLSIPDKIAAAKLRCYMAYFSTIGFMAITNDPVLAEIVTFQRIESSSPTWSTINLPVSTNVTLVDGLIEKEPFDVLKAVFSSKVIGGNILEDGCSQEEIMFIKCPECMVGLLIAPILNTNEAFRVYNCLQFAEVNGYAAEITFAGNIASEKIRHNLVMFDALICIQPDLQFTKNGIDRELTKVYSAIRKNDKGDEHVYDFATGKWGCGSMLGDMRLKFLIQLLAASVCGRQMRYHPLGDNDHVYEINELMKSVKLNCPTVGELYNYTVNMAKTNPETLLTRFSKT